MKPVCKGHLNNQEKMFLYDRCPFIAGPFKTWGRCNVGHYSQKVSLLNHKVSSCHIIHVIRVSLDDRFLY